MHIVFEVAVVSAVFLIIAHVSSRSFDESMEEWNQVVPGIDYPVKCPEKGKHLAKIYYEEDFLNLKNTTFNGEVQPLSDNGVYTIQNISLKDTNDYVCVYKEPEIQPYTVHVMVIAGDPFDYLNHTEIFHPGMQPPTPGPVEISFIQQRQPLKRDRETGVSEREEIVYVKESATEAESSMVDEVYQEYPDGSEKMLHDQLGDYNVGPAVNTNSAPLASNGSLAVRIKDLAIAVLVIATKNGATCDYEIIVNVLGQRYAFKCNDSTSFCAILSFLPALRQGLEGEMTDTILSKISAQYSTYFLQKMDIYKKDVCPWSKA